MPSVEATCTISVYIYREIFLILAFIIIDNSGFTSQITYYSLHLPPRASTGVGHVSAGFFNGVRDIATILSQVVGYGDAHSIASRLSVV